MELSDAGLRQQPFRANGKPLTVVTYAAQVAALDFLAATYADDHGLGLFQGPPLSGKSTIIRQFTDSLSDETAFAVVDGAGVETDALLRDILRQFGYDLQFDTVKELINMLKVFVVQQTVSNRAPLLIVENTHAMNPAALATLCALVALKVHEKSALRVILASDRSMAAMVKAPAMSCIDARMTGSFFVEPLSDFETKNYVYEKMLAAGCPAPQTIFPADVCLRLHSSADGWPGIVDRLALLALRKAERFPVTGEMIEQPPKPQDIRTAFDATASPAGDGRNGGQEAPKLYVSHNGETVAELRLEGERLLVGRSEHNELRISSRFISRHHALFVRHGNSTFLMDLNSTNGTFVNSRRISNLMLKNDDIVLIGNHRIKFEDPTAMERTPLDDAGFSETIVMKNLEDIRRLLAREQVRRGADAAGESDLPHSRAADGS
jgi:type II secretory pathway predicted ATPase ExeA